MKKSASFVLGGLAFSTIGLFAAKMTDNELKLGEPGTADPVAIEFDTNDGATNVRLNATSGKLEVQNGSIQDTEIDLSASVASATNRMVVSAATNATLTGLAREEGAIYYDSDNDQLVVDDGAELKAIGAGGLTPVVVTANFTAETGNQYIWNSSSTATTVTMPATSARDFNIQFVDDGYDWKTNNVTVDIDAGDTLTGQAAGEDLTLDIANTWVQLVGFQATNLVNKIDAIVPLGTEFDSISANSMTLTGNISADTANVSAVNFGDDDLNFYDEVTVVITGSGDFNGGTMNIVRVGAMVTISFSSQLSTPSTNASPNSAAGLVPSGFRPIDTASNVYEATSSVIRQFRVQSDGSIEVRNKNEALGTVAFSGHANPTISYTVN